MLEAGARLIGMQVHGSRERSITLNVYTQVLDGSLRTAVEKVGGELFTIVHKPEGSEARLS